MSIYTYTTLDDPSGDGTEARGVNDSGQIVGYSPGLSSGFLYSNGVYTTPGITFGITFPQGINDSGQIVGYVSEGRTSTGFVIQTIGANRFYSSIIDPLDPGINGTVATGISDSGQIVGYYMDASGKSHGFVFSNGGYTPLDYPFNTNGTFPTGINDSGQIVGYYFTANGVHGFLFSNGTYTTLDDPVATAGTYARGINDAGQIVGYYLDASGSHGFLYSNGVYTTIDDPFAGSNGTLPFGINDNGQIVGTYLDSSNHSHGFLLTITPATPATPATPTDSAVINGYVNAAHDTAAQALTGTADNNSTVTVYDNGTQIGTTTADASTGAWSFPKVCSPMAAATATRSPPPMPTAM
jgi:probable HAF family extracellular repeat protein